MCSVIGPFLSFSQSLKSCSSSNQPEISLQCFTVEFVTFLVDEKLKVGVKKTCAKTVKLLQCEKC